jgi:Tfp pilus assembly protein PilO
MNKDILNQEISLKNVAIIALVLGALFVYTYVLLYPKYSEYRTTKDNLNDVETELNSYRQKINDMPRLQDELAGTNSELYANSRRLNYDMENGMFLIGLSNYMEGFNVDLEEYTVDEPIKYETFYAIPATLKVKGNYRNIREVMYYLEEQKNMTQILDYEMVLVEPEEVPQEEVITTIQPDGSEITIPRTPVETPKPNGDITATFKLMVYSANDPTLELNTSNPNKWKPGKYNPFVPTVD